MPSSSTSPVLAVGGSTFTINNLGVVSFAAGQTFPGAGTITGVTAGSGLVGGGTSGNVTLSLTNKCAAGQGLEWNGTAWTCAALGTITGVTAGTGLTGGGTSGNVTLNVDTTKIPFLTSANTFGASQNISFGNLGLPNTSGSLSGVLTIGPTSFLHNYGPSGSNNTFAGGAGNFTTTGLNLTGVGYGVLTVDSSGQGSTAMGSNALSNVTTASYNTGFGIFAGDTLDNSNMTAGNNTFLGAGAHASTGSLTNATAIGSNAVVGESNALVLGCIGGQNNCGTSVNVGIGTTTPAYTLDVSNGDAVVRGANNFTTNGNTAHLYVGDTNHAIVATNGGGIGISTYQKPNALWVQDVTGFVGIGTTSPDHLLTLVQGGGAAIADGWNTYSSRRWKTNIKTLNGALGKVEQLRGVSYDLKDSGKHEIGVIAEEVGAVVPEIVSWEKNGKDARGVDYSRLTALLIEATKEQQALIDKQEAQIKTQQTQIKAQQVAAITRQRQIAKLAVQVRTVQATISTNDGSNTVLTATR